MKQQCKSMKSYKCDVCEFSTETAERLTIHNNVKHLLRKDFQCSKCDFKSGLKPELRRHEKYFHGEYENVLQCNICQYSGSRKADYFRHMKT